MEMVFAHVLVLKTLKYFPPSCYYNFKQATFATDVSVSLGLFCLSSTEWKSWAKKLRRKNSNVLLRQHNSQAYIYFIKIMHS